MHILAPYLKVQLWPAKEPSADVVHVYRVCPQRHVATCWAIHLGLALIKALYELPAPASMHTPLRAGATAAVLPCAISEPVWLVKHANNVAARTLQNMLLPSKPEAPSTWPTTCSSAIYLLLLCVRCCKPPYASWWRKEWQNQINDVLQSNCLETL